MHMNIEDTEQLLNRDSDLKFEISVCHMIFAKSNQPVILDSVKMERVQYEKLEFIEFLALVVWCAEEKFSDSELNDIPLEEKVKSVIDDIFVVDPSLERVEIEKIIEEFSESDDY